MPTLRLTRPRWFRFSLRKLFVVVTVLVVSFSLVTQRARTRHRTLHAIVAAGGYWATSTTAPKTFLHWISGDSPVLSIGLPPGMSPDLSPTVVRGIFPEADVHIESLESSLKRHPELRPYLVPKSK